MSSKRPDVRIVNMRPVAGRLESVGAPISVDDMAGWRPLDEGIFANGNNLNIDGSLIAAPGKPLCAHAGAVMCQNGVVGGLPSRWPFVRFSVHENGESNVVVGERSLSGALSSGTSLSGTVRRQLIADFEQAYIDASASAADAGNFVAPVVAYCRFLDANGAVLHNTPPVFLRPSNIFNPYAQLTVTDDKLVEAYAVAVPTFSISVSFEPIECPEVAAAEIVITPQAHPYYPEGPAEIVKTRQNGSLRVSLPGYGCRFTDDNSASHERILRLLGASDKLGNSSLIVASPFSVAGKSVQIRKSGDNDAAVEARSIATALKSASERPLLREVLLAPPHRFSAACVAADASVVAWGGLKALRFEGFSPAYFAESVASDKAWRALATVYFANSRKAVSFSAEYPSSAPLSFSPVISYPSPDATRMSITIFCDGITRSRTFPLEPDTSGRRAVFINDGLKNFELPVTSASLVVDSENADVDFPGAIAFADSRQPFTLLSSAYIAGDVQALAVLPQADTSWEFGRCRFIAAGSGGISAVGYQISNKSFSARTLDTRACIGRDSLAQASDGVFAAVDGAILLIERGKRAPNQIINVSAESIAWVSETRELLAELPYGEYICWSIDHNAYYIRDDIKGSLLMAAGRPYALSDKKLARLDIEDPNSSPGIVVQWEFEPSIISPIAPCAMAIRAEGRLIEAVATIEAVSGSGNFEPLCSIAFSGTICSPLVAPILSRRCRRLRFCLKGDAENILFNSLILKTL